MPEKPTRRSWISGVIAAVASLVPLGRAFGVAPPNTKVPVGPEPSPEPPQKPATKARGEAGRVTTDALNEEGAATRARNENGAASTLGLREEGAMTRALNENGNKPVTKALNENGIGKITTLAVGEEGAKKE